MILQSVANGHPIMHVELNYRLGGQYSAHIDFLKDTHVVKVFGFAQSAALRKEGSENAGIRDMVRIIRHSCLLCRYKTNYS